jgi:type I restriction enzyme M protein
MSNLSGFVKRIRDIMRNDAGINGDAQRIEQMAWMLFLKVYDAKEQDWDMNEDNYESIIPEECRWCNWAVDDRSGSAMTGDTLLDFVNNTLFPTMKSIKVDPNTPIKKAIVKTAFEDVNQYMKDGVLLRQLINIIDELDLSDYAEIHAFGAIYEDILKELQSAGSSGEFYTPRAVTDFMAKMIEPKIGEKMADFACGTGGFITSWLKELEPKVKDTEDREAYDDSIYGIEKKPFPYILCVTNMLLHGLDVPRVYHDNSLLRDVLDYTESDQFDVILMNPPYGGSEKADVKNHFPDDLASSETADLFMAVIMYRLKKNGRAAVILPDGFLFGLDNAKVNLKKKLLKEFNLHTIIRMPGSVFAPYTSITTNILFFDNTKPTEETWFYRLDMPSDRKHFSKTKPMELKHFDPVVEWWNNRQEITLDGFDKAKCYTAEQIADELGYNLDQCGYPHKEEEILAPMDLMQRYQEERASLNAELDRVLAELSVLLGGAVE